MSRCSFLLLRMNCSCRLFPYVTVDQEAYSKENERNAEPLTHIQYHVLLEHYLRFLDELYEETHSETSYEECSDEESAVEFVESVLVRNLGIDILEVVHARTIYIDIFCFFLHVDLSYRFNCKNNCFPPNISRKALFFSFEMHNIIS